jgi:hypothetical protein
MIKPQTTSKEAYASLTETVNALRSLRHEDNLRVDSSPIVTACTFHSIKPRHYSLHQLEQKLEESVCVDELDLDSNPERDLWLAEASILCDLDVALEHVRFTKLQPIGYGMRLKVVGTTRSTSHVNRVYTVVG